MGRGGEKEERNGREKIREEEKEKMEEGGGDKEKGKRRGINGRENRKRKCGG